MKIIIKASTFVSKLFSYTIPIILTLWTLISCTTIKQDFQSTIITENYHPAIAHKKVTKENLVYHITTIHLDHSDISINASKPSTNNTYTTNGETTKQFAQETGASVAINASPFSYPASRLSRKRLIEGVYIHEGSLISKQNEHYGALCFTKEKQAYIVNSQTDDATKNAYFAFAGFWTILEGNTILPFKDIKDARTAVGINKDGFTMFILSVEKSKNSTGLNFMECAKILQQEGATKAIQLDGGNSTSLILANNPKDSITSNRKVANSLGIFVNTEIQLKEAF